MKILISRTDNIGDLIVSLPLASLLKHHYPGAQIWFLARPYIKDIFQYADDVTGMIDWDQLKQLPIKEAATYIKAQKFDIFFNLESKKSVARMIKQAGINIRIGFASRWLIWIYCNRWAHFRREPGFAHESQRVVTLLRALNLPSKYSKATLLAHLNLRFPTIEPAVEAWLDKQRFNLILHPCSNGHGREWPLESFSELIRQLPKEKFKLFISGTESERNKLTPLLKQHPDVTVILGEFNLEQFIQFISRCDGLVASGTGPLHLAAALGIHTLGLFPPITTRSPTRWGPLGKRAESLVHEIVCKKVCSNEQCACMRSITVASVAAKLNGWLSNSNPDTVT